MLKLIILFIIICSSSELSTGGGDDSVAVSSSDRKFKCRRPVAQMVSFKPKLIGNRDLNCFFGAIEVTSASAEVVVHPFYGELAVRINASFIQYDKLVNSSYQVKVSKVGDSTVHYKGYQDEFGFSMCCYFLDGAACEWQDKTDEPGLKQHVVLACPLNQVPVKNGAPSTDNETLTGGDVEDNEVDYENGVVITGSVTKALHKRATGAWLATWIITDMWGEQVGQLLMPFTVSEEDLKLSSVLLQNSASSTTNEETDVVSGNVSPDQQQQQQKGSGNGPLVAPLPLAVPPTARASSAVNEYTGGDEL